MVRLLDATIVLTPQAFSTSNLVLGPVLHRSGQKLNPVLQTKLNISLFANQVICYK
jgi:hypothetical protein